MNEWEWQLLEDKTPVDAVDIDGAPVRQGDRVILRPRKGGDIFDLALTGRVAIVEAIEQDYEGKLHLAVVVEEDPGIDLGVLRQPGHRFFFTPEEVEPCAGKPKILIAGIGNIFLGDDGFGVEVIRQLAQRTFPDSVRIRDFGIRGYDLMYALQDGYEMTILVDACPRGERPGTVYVIEPDLEQGDAQTPVTLDAHTMNPVSVLRLAKTMGPISKRVLLVACEPATLGGEEGYMGLSEPVSIAVTSAVRVVEELVSKNLNGGAAQ